MCLFDPCFERFGTCEGTIDNTLNHTLCELSDAADHFEVQLQNPVEYFHGNTWRQFDELKSSPVYVSFLMYLYDVLST